MNLFEGGIECFRYQVTNNFLQVPGTEAVVPGATLITFVVYFIFLLGIGLSVYMYEIVPGFTANCLMIFLLNGIIKQKNGQVLKQYQEVVDVIIKQKQF